MFGTRVDWWVLVSYKGPLSNAASSYSEVASESVSNNNITGPTIFFQQENNILDPTYFQRDFKGLVVLIIIRSHSDHFKPNDIQIASQS